MLLLLINGSYTKAQLPRNTARNLLHVRVRVNEYLPSSVLQEGGDAACQQLPATQLQHDFAALAQESSLAPVPQTAGSGFEFQEGTRKADRRRCFQSTGGGGRLRYGSEREALCSGREKTTQTPQHV